MRQYTRHDASIPIEVSLSGDSANSKALVNLSVGGLCCEADQPIAVGTVIDIQIPGSSPLYQSQGVVAWCSKIGHSHYEIGVHFQNSEQAFRARMVEQVCQIERYKKLILQTEGRHMSSEEAAREWIDKFAAKFSPCQPCEDDEQTAEPSKS